MAEIQYVTKDTLEQMRAELQRMRGWTDPLPVRLLLKQEKRAI
jgi:hypothetical protein